MHDTGIVELQSERSTSHGVGENKVTYDPDKPIEGYKPESPRKKNQSEMSRGVQVSRGYHSPTHPIDRIA